jgi:hypothetical protein
VRWSPIVLALGVVGAACCGHPPRPPIAAPDDQRAGAIELAWDPDDHQFAAEGALDPAAGDAVDWYTLTLLPDQRTRLNLLVVAPGRQVPATVEIADRVGVVQARVPVTREGDVEVARAIGVVLAGRLYLRLTATGGAFAYTVIASSVHGLGPPAAPPGPACDPRRWDPADPACVAVCDFAAPALDHPGCCRLLTPCVTAPRDTGWRPCGAAVERFDGELVTIARGRADAGIDHLEAVLELTAPEPGRALRAAHDDPPQLALVSADAHRSRWRLAHPELHDLAWLADHARGVAILPPPICRGAR